MKKYFKCDECWSILETIYCDDIECLNCEWQVLEQVWEDWETPQWVKWCSSCSKKLTCDKVEI